MAVVESVPESFPKQGDINCMRVGGTRGIASGVINSGIIS